MKFFNKYFFIGLGSGVLLTFILIIGLSFLASYLIMGPKSEKAEKANNEATAPPPPMVMKDEEVVFLIISKEKQETVQSFMEKKQFSFPVYLYSGEVPNGFRSKSIPATFILDRDGVIAYKHVGSANWADENCLGYIRGLL